MKRCAFVLIMLAFLLAICSCAERVEDDGACTVHIFETEEVSPTCISDGYKKETCLVCGEVRENVLEMLDHEAPLRADQHGHWIECELCKARTKPSDHTPDALGFCSACEYPVVPTDGVIYEVVKEKPDSSGTATVVGYAGDSSTVIIADRYNGAIVKKISATAFRDSTVTRIGIPSHVRDIPLDTFSGCGELERIDVADNNEIYASKDGVLYKRTRGGLSEVLKCGEANKSENIVIPSGVITVGAEAFKGARYIKSVTLPTGVTTIGGAAFSGCMALESVVLPSSLEDVPDDSFVGCPSLEFYERNGGLYLGNPNEPCMVLVKAESSSLKSFSTAFETKIIFPEAFAGCTELAEIDFSYRLRRIGDGAFRDCVSICKIYLPVGVSVGKEAFSGCKSLAKVRLSGSPSIGEGAFRECTSLVEIEIPAEARAVSKNLFYGCTALERVILPDGITAIGENAFEKCTALKSIQLPSTLSIIRKCAFIGCASLESIGFAMESEWEAVTLSPYIRKKFDNADPAVNAEYIVSSYARCIFYIVSGEE